MTTTTDFQHFGYREFGMAGDLLKAYAYNPPSYLGDGVHIMFNINSGYVFLIDEDFNVAMMNGDKLEQFHNCSKCGGAGFAEDMSDNECCQEYLKGELDQ